MDELTLADLKLILRDVFENRADALNASHSGQAYAFSLAAKRQAIDALPEALVGGKPLTGALKDADREHDGLVRAVYYLTEAYLGRASLRDADLSSADLRDADLRGANLCGANLREAIVTDEQLAQAKSLRGAIMPDGTKHD